VIVISVFLGLSNPFDFLLAIAVHILAKSYVLRSVIEQLSGKVTIVETLDRVPVLLFFQFILHDPEM